MAIDPLAKVARNQRLAEQARQRRQSGTQARRASRALVRPRRGPISKGDRAAIAHVVQDTQGLVQPEQIAGLARALRRDVTTIESAIQQAREKFQQDAGFYVQAHQRVVEHALNQPDDPKMLDVARKGAAWAMANISGKDASGRTVRIVDAKDEPRVPSVQIGIALGGLPAAAVDSPQVSDVTRALPPASDDGE